VGRAYLRDGELAAAVAEMDQSLAIEPHGLWPNYYKGLCALRMGRSEEALVAFSVCVALAPDRGWCYFNRGLALAERGRTDAARADFEHAHRLDPGLAMPAPMATPAAE
jgi:Flp pilus assembly protein TadD